MQKIDKKISSIDHIIEIISPLKIDPISQEIKKLLNDSTYLDQILSDGSKKAEEIASKKSRKIHEILGF